VSLIGVGTDIVEIARIEKALKIYGERFITRILTRKEILLLPPKKQGPWLAKRFAGKEAIVKALGCGFSQGVSWQDFSIANNRFGQPQVEIQGVASKLWLERVQGQEVPDIHLSLSDSRFYAVAFAVIEAPTAAR